MLITYSESLVLKGFILKNKILIKPVEQAKEYSYRREPVVSGPIWIRACPQATEVFARPPGAECR
ncbi:MAG: hypothetical protein JSS81_07800 [Acidobacteria bacterium]|nr:hypothetical protein [Acidobacteriota bacterium]